MGRCNRVVRIEKARPRLCLITAGFWFLKTNIIESLSQKTKNPARLAQLVERVTSTLDTQWHDEVTGSNPLVGNFLSFFECESYCYFYSMFTSGYALIRQEFSS